MKTGRAAGRFAAVVLAGSVVLVVIGFKFTRFPWETGDVNATLAERGIPVDRGLIQTRTRSVAFAAFGDADGPAVVFIHGSPGSWDNFLHLLTDPELLRRTRLIALDRPGFGGSSAGGHEPSLARQAEVVEAILAEVIGDRRAVVVAHSYGGAVAVRLAVDAPGRVGALVLVAPSVDPDLEVVRWVQRVAEWPGVSLLVPRALRTANREILPLKKELQDLEARWSEVRVPVTVIHGEKDRLVPVANLDYASRLLAHTDVKAVRTRDEGHFILWTRPDLIRDSILGYVEEMEASASAPHLPSEPKIRLPQSAPPR